MTQPATTTVRRLATVSYLNAKPLTWGLESTPGVQLVGDVPAKLIDRLADGRAEVALLPTIDYQRLEGLRIIPAGGIGCDGETLTVRLFSHKPLSATELLVCDPDSHTSVALARIVLAKQYNVRPRVVSLAEGQGLPGETRLLIGDKVVCEEPLGFQHQIDLGLAWKELTGLPFVFAVWTATESADVTGLHDMLQASKEQGLTHVDAIVSKYAVPRGWPAGIAWQYLTGYLKYDIGPRQLEAIRLFHQLAGEHALLNNPVRPLSLAE
ncbi:MAG: menaquinone biosynthetic enzyme MqnA/MqnD family protein [Phycisphaerae bacterium]